MLNGFRCAGFQVTRASFCGVLRLSLLLLFAGFTSLSARAGVLLLQHASKDAGVTSSSSLAFPSNNTTGNWIGVVIRAGHSGQILTVNDTRGNIYKQALQSNETLDTPNGETFAIYYAENIAAGANTVTVTESLTNNTLRFAILEYSGIATTNSLDVTAAGQSSGTTFTSGNATTTVGGDLILGEVTSADGVTFTAGSGYSIEERVPAAPSTKLIVEDAVPLAAGTISVSATVSISNNGGAMLAAFKAVTGTLPPSITSLNPTSGPAGTSVTIAGTNFDASQGTSTVSFNGTPATPTSWSATTIVASVPAGATTGSVVVTVGGLASNGVAFTVLVPPSITNLSPASGPLGTAVTITGASFGASQGTGTITLNGASLPVTNWTDTSIATFVPNGATSGNVVVTARGLSSNGVLFAVTPSINSLSPTSGPAGTPVTISGANFGPTQGTSSVMFGSSTAVVTSWSNTSIIAIVPSDLSPYTNVGVKVTVSGASALATFSITPNITSLSPTVGPAGTSVTITGTNFTLTQSINTVTFNGTPATPTSWGPTSIVVPVPAVATTGNVVVTVSGFASNAVAFTVLPTPSITNLSPTSGPLGTSVMITGTNFGSSQGTSTVTFGGTPATPTSWSATSIMVPVPSGATTGNVAVTVGGVPSNGIAFTVIPPSITSLSASSGAIGTSVTITGTNFGAIQGTSVVRFNGTVASPVSWGDTIIVVPVPGGATTGNVVVTVGALSSNGLLFTVIVPPTISSLSPAFGSVGTSVTISGTNLGPAQGVSTITFNGTPATPTSWNGTTILVTVPVGATTGNVVVTVNGLPSNGAPFTVNPISVSVSPTAVTLGTGAQQIFSLSVQNDSLGQGVTWGLSGAGCGGAACGTIQPYNAAPGEIYNAPAIAPNPSTVTLTATSITDPTKSATATITLFQTTPNITSLSPTSGPAGMSVTIAGTNFGASQGTSTVTFNGAAATPTSWSSNSIIVSVPSGATTGNVVVTEAGFASNGVPFTVVPAPSITSLNPTSAPVGASVTITGTTFGASQGTSTVTFNGTAATPTSWSPTSIVVLVPSGATSGNVVVSVAGLVSNGALFTVVPPPTISSLTPASAAVGAGVTIAGTNFGSSQGTGTVTFKGIAATTTSWNATSIVAFVPSGAATGNVVVTVAGVPSNAVVFTVLPIPTITSLSPTSGPAGTAVTITGTNFGATQGTSTAAFNGTLATPTSWGSTTIVVPVPTGATTGNVVVTASGFASNGVPFTIPPSITSLSPTFGPVGTLVTITGTNFAAFFQGTSTITFNGTAAAPTSWSDTSIVVPVPSGATTGNVVVGARGFASNGVNFTVTPNISGLNPNTGPAFTSVTVSGSNFGASQGTSTVTFGGIGVAPTSWSNSSFVVSAPNFSVGPAGVQVFVGGFGSNAVAFQVTPAINSLSPTSGPSATSVTISGTSFGVTQGTSTVTFNGTVGTPTSWGDNAITVPVPSAATTGNVVVTVKGVASNGVNFTVTPTPPDFSLSTAPSSATVIAGSPASYTENITATGGFTGSLSLSISGLPAGASGSFSPNPATGASSALTVTTNSTTPAGSYVFTVTGTSTNPALTHTSTATLVVQTAPPPSITSLNPTFGLVGTSVTIAGANFGATQGTSTVTFNGIAATPTSWATTSITVPVPAGATTGNVMVTVGGVASNGVVFTVTSPPSITSLSPTSGPVGSSVFIIGTNFGPPGNNTVTFNGTAATIFGLTGTTISVVVPSGATTGNVVVTVSGVVSNGVIFTVTPPPSITSLSPTSGPVGSSVTIAGANFGASQGTGAVTFNGSSATPTSWSTGSIVVPVPTGATTGPVFVTVSGGVASNGVNFTVTTTPANIALVQHASKDAGVTSSSSLAFPSNNTAGNWIGVVIRAGHSGQVLTVSDTHGNAYRQGMQSNETLDGPNGETFAIYYAENISGGANTVTVAQSITNNTLRFAILEYSGVATSNSLDVIAAAQGTGTAPNSGNATTTAGGDLVLGMIVTANGATVTAGSGFTIEETVPAAPNTKLIVEDGAKSAVSAVAANATLTASDNWGAGFAAFKAAAGGGAGPNITSLNPASGPVGTPVTITGTNFGASQGTSTVTFNGTTATPTSWTATSIGAPVPAGATNGNVVVTVGGVASSGVPFSVTASAPSITNLNPTSGPVGTPITITGTNFGVSQGTSAVTFNGVTATPTNWSATSIAVPVPAGATTGSVVVKVGGITSNGVNFSVTSTAPSISNLNPTSGAVATPVTITGTNFGSSQGTSTVTFNGTTASPTSWNATTIVAPVPSGATSGNVVVTVGGVASNGVNFTVTAPATNGIALVQHTSKDAGVITSSSSLAFSSANIAGNFIAVVIRGGKAFQVFTVSDSRGNTYHQAIQANLTVDGESDAIYYAESIAGGANTVTVAESITNNTLRFAILEYSGVAPSSSLDVTASSQGTDTSPSSGNATTTGVGELLIAEITNANGTTFGAGSGLTLEESVPAAPGSKLLVEDGIEALPGVVSGTASMAALDNWGAVLAAFRPASAGAGPHIVSVSPRTSPVGSQVTIAGTNFGSTQGASTVTFNGTPAASKTWSATSIVVTVPAGATSGNVVVTVGGSASNGFNFTVGFAPPISFVQAGSNQNVDAPLPTAQNFITVVFKGAQTTGNMNVVVVGWQDSSATVASVTDTVGNVYRLANNAVVSGTASLSIYYASDILPSPPNTNVVAVTFNGLATNGDVRIAEYAGLDPTNPLDVAVSGQGSNNVSNSNSISTTNANDLLVGANVVYAKSTAAGAGYTNRVISLNGGILEDQIVSATGNYSATATLSGGGNWIMQMVAFKALAAAAPGITIAVSPLAANTATGFGTRTFTATLQNDVQRLGVAWGLTGSGCSGITCGSLSNITATSATYTAPANLPSPATVSLTATSVADSTKAASATITVTQGTLNVAISPKRAAVTLTQVQQFNATVTNDPPNAGVVWSVDSNNGGNATVGTVSSTGLFTPGTQAGVHTVTASSVSNASANVSATVAVTDLAGVFTYHYDSQSTGQNTKEYALTSSTVTPSTFGLLFNCPVDGFMFANPLYVANLTIGGQTHNVVFLATEHNSVYAFDADSPSCVQLWKTSFLSTGVTTVPPADTGDGVSLVVEFGITGTPVIDPATHTLYVVANTKETVGTGCSQASPCFFYRLHALDLLTGAEKFGGPVLVAAPNFNPLAHLQRPALLLNNGTVYVAFGSHADLNIYQGWVMAYNASTLAQIYAWPSTVPTGGNNQGAIWGSGNPPVADASGNVYVVTGNGTWDGAQNFSDSLVRLSSSGGVPPDYFTPFDQSTFNINDIDLGSSGAMILPDTVGSATHPHVMIVTGKVGVIYLLDQTNLGKFHNGSNQDLEEVVLGFNLTSADSGFYGQPAYWNGNLYAAIVADFLRQFPVSNASIASTASSVAPKLYPYRGATPSVSANGNANGIVWIEDANPYLFNGPSILDAYDASRVATQLYSSPMTGNGAACSASKFIVPVVANGKVYISGSNCFSVFGLLPN
jgi:hypothetical protein